MTAMIDPPASVAEPPSVGLILATVQFFFTLTWVVYVIYLPALAEQVGIPRSATLVLLMVDQLIFLFADYGCGVMADRMARLNSRFGPAVLAVTLLSAAAFTLLPWVAPTGSAPLFLALMVLWSLGSSVLRAPPMNLIGRYTARSRQPRLVALSMLGLGLASALAPYLALALKGVDPRWPFLLSSLTLAVSTVGIVAAERILQRRVAGGHSAPLKPAASGAALSVPVLQALAVALLIALAFQLHVFLNSAPLYLRLATAAELPWLMPAFWVGFNLGLWLANWCTQRWGAPWVLAVAAAAAALGASAVQAAGALGWLVAAQAATGVAWAAVLTSAFAAALAIGQGGREGRSAGALSSVLALAALSRMGLTFSGLAATAPGTVTSTALQLGPVMLWALAAGAAWMALQRHSLR